MANLNCRASEARREVQLNDSIPNGVCFNLVDMTIAKTEQFHAKRIFRRIHIMEIGIEKNWLIAAILDGDGVRHQSSLRHLKVTGDFFLKRQRGIKRDIFGITDIKGGFLWKSIQFYF